MTPAEVAARAAARIHGRPRRDDPAGARACGRPGCPTARGPTAASAERAGRSPTGTSCGACSTRSRRDHPARRRHPRLLPGRAGADRGLRPIAAAASDSPTSRSRSAGRRVFMRAYRRRDARLAGATGQGPEGVLLGHADPRRLDPRTGRVLPARGQRPDAPAAHDPRGRPRPLPPGRVRQSLPVAGPRRSSGAASSPRAGRST